jgi:hypothetical protein
MVRIQPITEKRHHKANIKSRDLGKGAQGQPLKMALCDIYAEVLFN